MIRVLNDYDTVREPLKEIAEIMGIKSFQFDKKISLIYFTKDYFKMIKPTGETLLQFNNFYLDLKMSINSFSVIDGIYNLRPRVVVGFTNGEILKVSSIFTNRLDHFHLLQKKNIKLEFFPEFTEKLVNQNEEYLIVWDLDKNGILQSKETKESNHIMFMDRVDRNKNFKCLVYSKGAIMNSRNIYYEKKKWRITEGKKITPLYDLKYDDKESVEITLLKRLEEYHCYHKDRILVGFSNGNMALFQFYNSRCLFHTRAHKKKINDIIHLKEYNVNHFASCSDSLTIKIWDFESKKMITELKGHVKKITNLFYLKNFSVEYIASSSHDGNIIIWNFVKREKLKIMKNDGVIKDALYLDDYNPSTFVTVLSNNNILIWQQKKEQVFITL